MTLRMFDSPVFVKSGNTVIEEITCLEDALEFLYEWPKKRRNAIYQTALRACRAVIDSGYPLESARASFVSFARYAGILEKVDTLLPWSIRIPDSGGSVAA